MIRRSPFRATDADRSAAMLDDQRWVRRPIALPHSPDVNMLPSTFRKSASTFTTKPGFMANPVFRAGPQSPFPVHGHLPVLLFFLAAQGLSEPRLLEGHM